MNAHPQVQIQARQTSILAQPVAQARANTTLSRFRSSISISSDSPEISFERYAKSARNLNSITRSPTSFILFSSLLTSSSRSLANSVHFTKRFICANASAQNSKCPFQYVKLSAHAGPRIEPLSQLNSFQATIISITEIGAIITIINQRTARLVPAGTAAITAKGSAPATSNTGSLAAERNKKAINSNATSPMFPLFVGPFLPNRWGGCQGERSGGGLCC
jgi:hypothetical protein